MNIDESDECNQRMTRKHSLDHNSTAFGNFSVFYDVYGTSIDPKEKKNVIHWKTYTLLLMSVDVSRRYCRANSYHVVSTGAETSRLLLIPIRSSVHWIVHWEIHLWWSPVSSGRLVVQRLNVRSPERNVVLLFHLWPVVHHNFQITKTKHKVEKNI